MNFAIITDHASMGIHYGAFDNVKTATHSTNSNIDFVKTEFELSYAVALIECLHTSYKSQSH